MHPMLCRMASLHRPRFKKDAIPLIRQARKDKLSLPKGNQQELAAKLVKLSETFRSIRSKRLITEVPAERSVQERFRAYVRRLFRDAYRYASFRCATAGEHTLTIHLTEDPVMVGCTGGSEKGERYSSRCTFRRTDSFHSFTIPKAWIRKVYKAGLAKCGVLVLDADPVPGNQPTYKAVWVEQLRGFSLRAKRGYIARLGNWICTGKAAASASNRLKRRLRAILAEDTVEEARDYLWHWRQCHGDMRLIEELEHELMVQKLVA